MTEPTPRVFSLAPLPPEKCAYALARYSRSPDSIEESLEWVRTHDSPEFLESFYFQYGHASIADPRSRRAVLRRHLRTCRNRDEDEHLWDGQARSSRYQDFGKSGFVVPLSSRRRTARVTRRRATLCWPPTAACTSKWSNTFPSPCRNLPR